MEDIISMTQRGQRPSALCGVDGFLVLKITVTDQIVYREQNRDKELLTTLVKRSHAEA